MSASESFLIKHGLSPQNIDVNDQSEKMLKNMKSGLNGNIVDMPMIKTYLSTEGKIKEGKTAAVIDAGGTNFRSALATYKNGKIEIEGLFTSKMPGKDKPVTWDEFISFVADSISPFIDKTDLIGFCFSYSAAITPEIDGIVSKLEKEIIIYGCEGKHIGKDLTEELSRRGFLNKRCIVLNDTVAALLGNESFLNKENYSGYIGMICGTGVNTCASFNGMLINLESGSYSGMPRGDIDEIVDLKSIQPKEKLMEKMCSGAYIGEIAKYALNLEENIDGAAVDSMTQGSDEFKKNICNAIIARSARCMASNILAIIKLSNNKVTKPFCVCAEGSLIEKSANYLKFLNEALEENCDNINVEIRVGHNTTLPGSAIAAMLNG